MSYSAGYDPVYAAKRYKEVIRPRNGHVPGGQGRRYLLDRDEHRAITVLKRIDAHIRLVDDARIRGRLRSLAFLRSRPGHGQGKGRKSLYTGPEQAALRAHFKMARRKLFCVTCGNDRRVLADTPDGKCRGCDRTKKKGRKAKLRAEGKWRAMHSAVRQRRAARIRNAPGSGVTAPNGAPSAISTETSASSAVLSPSPWITSFRWR